VIAKFTKSRAIPEAVRPFIKAEISQHTIDKWLSTNAQKGPQVHNA
jgi:hypothetical protein